MWKNSSYWPLRDITRSASAIQFPPTPPTMVPNMRGLVIIDTRSGLVFEQLVIIFNEGWLKLQSK